MPRRHKGQPPRDSRYLPIAQYLATQEADTLTLTLSLAQVEAILGFPLPVTAYIYSTWWRDTEQASVRSWADLGWEARLSYKTHVVVFTRTVRQEEEQMPRPGAPKRGSKYQPLADFLAAQEEDMIRLTLAEIEALIGGPLPDTAYTNGNYWRTKRSPAARTWINRGWEAAQLDRRGQAVVFQCRREE